MKSRLLYAFIRIVRTRHPLATPYRKNGFVSQASIYDISHTLVNEDLLCTEALFNISCEVQYHTMLFNLGIIQFLSYLTIDCGPRLFLDSRQYISGILSELSCVTSNQLMLIEQGGIELVYYLCREQNEEIRTNCAIVLCNLSCKQENLSVIKEKDLACRVIKALSALMLSSSESIRLFSIEGFRNYLSDSGFQEAIETNMNTLNSLILCTQRYPRSTSMDLPLFQLFFNVLCNNNVVQAMDLKKVLDCFNSWIASWNDCELNDTETVEFSILAMKCLRVIALNVSCAEGLLANGILTHCQSIISYRSLIDEELCYECLSTLSNLSAAAPSISFENFSEFVPLLRILQERNAITSVRAYRCAAGAIRNLSLYCYTLTIENMLDIMTQDLEAVLPLVFSLIGYAIEGETNLLFALCCSVYNMCHIPHLRERIDVENRKEIIEISTHEDVRVKVAAILILHLIATEGKKKKEGTNGTETNVVCSEAIALPVFSIINYEDDILQKVDAEMRNLAIVPSEPVWSSSVTLLHAGRRYKQDFKPVKWRKRLLESQVRDYHMDFEEPPLLNGSVFQPRVLRDIPKQDYPYMFEKKFDVIKVDNNKRTVDEKITYETHCIRPVTKFVDENGA